MFVMPIDEFLRRSAVQAEKLDIFRYLGGPAKAEKTLLTYRRIWDRYKFDEKAMEGLSRASFKVHRAALLHCSASAFSISWRSLHAALKSGGVAEELELRDRERVTKALLQFKAVLSAEKPPAGGEKSAKTTLRKRADWKTDWQAEAYTKVPRAGRLAVALLWAMPIRPAELHAGVELELLDNGDVRVVAPGVKVSQITGGGQEWRVVVLDGDTPPVRLLRLELEAAGARHMRYARNMHTLRHDLENAGEAMGMEGRLCAYVFRHITASDLKADKDQERTALAMGHASARSQTGYGYSSRGRAGRSPILSVDAPQPVRHVGEIAWNPAAIPLASDACKI